MEGQVVVLLPKTTRDARDTFPLVQDSLDTSHMKESAARREVKVDTDLACYTNQSYRTAPWFTVGLRRKAYLCLMSLSTAAMRKIASCSSLFCLHLRKGAFQRRLAIPRVAPEDE